MLYIYISSLASVVQLHCLSPRALRPALSGDYTLLSLLHTIFKYPSLIEAANIPLMCFSSAPSTFKTTHTMPCVDFRDARHHEPPRAKRKCRVFLRNSRSRSSSHSENDAEYMMGLSKTGASREWNIIDERFDTTLNAMSQR